MTGVLPVALENATKVMQVLLGLNKEYVGVMYLHEDVELDILRNAIEKYFLGEIIQVPPVKSAVSRKPRKRKIFYFDLLEKEGKNVLFKVGCEAGVYIRKLCSDLGKKVGIGIHMKELRRTKVGNFVEEDAHSLVEIKDAYEMWKSGEEKFLRKILIPIEYAILHVKRVFVKDSAIYNITNGSPVYVSGLVRIQEGIEKGEVVAIYSLKEELIAIGIAKMNSKEMLEKKKGMAIRTDRVFMEKGIYPREL